MSPIRKCVTRECPGHIWTGTKRPRPEICVFCWLTKYPQEFRKWNEARPSREGDK